MPDQTRFEKPAKSVIESDHPVFGKVKKELPNLAAKQFHHHPLVTNLLEWNVRFRLLPKLVALFIAVILSFFIYRNITDPYMDYRLGDSAQRHLIARKTVEMYDEETTEAKRRASVEGILSVYDYDRRIFFQTTERLRKAFSLVRREHLAAIRLVEKKMPISDLERADAFIQAKKAFSTALDTDITDGQFEAMAKLKFSRNLQRVFEHLLSRPNTNLIVSNRELLSAEQGKGISLNRIGEGNEQIAEQVYKNITSIIDVEAARQDIEADAKNYITGHFTPFAPQILQIAKKLVVPNLTLNRQETERRKRETASQIKPVLVKITKGETIIRYGETVTKRHLAILAQLEKAWEADNSFLQFLFTAVFLFIVIYSFYSFAEGGFYPYSYKWNDLAVFLGLMVSSILAIKGMQFLAVEALIDKFPHIPFDFYYFLVPVAAGPVMIRLLTVKEPALVFALILGVVGGILLDRNFFYACYVFASSLTATALSQRVKTRSVIYRAGLFTGFVNMVLITCIVANTRNAGSLSMLWQDMGWIFWAGMLSGLFTAALVVSVTPLIEMFSGHTTDLRLLELANMNHPLLRDLMVKAPGTYHHSIVIGSLVEAAAEAIGANPLLARVMAYYHDVGKMERPQYFIENQGGGYNKHDNLQPHMSAMIIRDHVKSGQEMGRKYKLPQPIIDAMSEHHGSSTIWYFFNKARAGAEDPDSVLESDYKYDGDKPQSKETALVMLGDVVEAATRSVADPSPMRLSGVVKNILNKYFAEGQLSECDLTLRDLDLIAKSFLDVLLGIYHARIEYGIPTLRDNLKKKHANGDAKGSPRVQSGVGATGTSGVTPLAKPYSVPGTGGSGSGKS